jgi:hypothetical protein
MNYALSIVLYNQCMRTTFGQECKYYYADFYRGRNQQECRLADANPESLPWNPDICRNCPVPGILMANACEHMLLRGWVVKGLFGFGRKMIVEPSCLKTKREKFDAHIGCGECQANSIALFFEDKPTR